MNNFTIAFPLKGKIGYNQHFGENATGTYASMGMKGHDGIDFTASDGTPVYAAHDGRVYFAGYDSAGGLGIKIRTEETHDYNGQQVYYSTIYWHLKTGTLQVTGSQQVKKGDLIAFSDNTGNSTGSHLHFGLYPMLRPVPYEFVVVDMQNGYNGAIDPAPYFEAMPIPKLQCNFNIDMKIGQTSSDIKILQDILKSEDCMGPLVPSTSYFGPLTKAGVIKLQEKYMSEILTPAGLSKGTGICASFTRAFLNKKYPISTV